MARVQDDLRRPGVGHRQVTEVVKFLGAQMAKNANEKFIVNGIYMKKLSKILCGKDTICYVQFKNSCFSSHICPEKVV